MNYLTPARLLKEIWPRTTGCGCPLKGPLQQILNLNFDQWAIKFIKNEK